MLTCLEAGLQIAAVHVVELEGVVAHGLPCTGVHGHRIEHIVAEVGPQAGAQRQLLPAETRGEAHDEVGRRRLVAIEVVGVDDAVAVDVGIGTLNGLARLLVIKLMIDVEHIRLIALSEHLELISVD